MIQDAKTGAIVQAVPLMDGKINQGGGTHTVTGLIHCEADGSIDLHFKTGDVPYSMLAGEDRAYNGSMTITTGTFTLG